MAFETDRVKKPPISFAALGCFFLILGGQGVGFRVLFFFGGGGVQGSGLGV